MRRVVSAYTPSNTDPEVLDRIFVQRRRLLEKLVDRLARSMTSSDKHHILLVGPRGSGKTHLVSLAKHELGNRPELDDVMRIAWLGEDDTIASLVDLAFAIAGQLASEYPDEFPRDYREAVRGLSSDDAAESVLVALAERLGERSVILIMENMDRAFRGLGDVGAKKWRAFLQEQCKFAILATSQQLFSGVSSRDEAFFGFFEVHHMKALTVEAAHELMGNISVEQRNEGLTRFLHTSAGRYRVRALHHLAGGNHRLYVLLSEFLTKDSLDDLVEAFELLADELTPYFQSRIRSLAPQQARIVECLCGATGAMTVKEVSEETFIAERNCSKQLGELKRKSYVRSQKQGKESFYEVTEPLMRLCLEVKQQRGRPLKLVAQFLRAWFSDEELRKGSSGTAVSSRGQRYHESAIQLQKGFDSSIAADLMSEISARIGDQMYDRAAALAAELHHIDPQAAAFVSATIAERNGAASIGEELSAVGDIGDVPTGLKARSLVNDGITHERQGDVVRAVSDYTAVVEMEDAPADQRAIALVSRGVVRGRQGDMVRALSDFTTVVEMEDAPADGKVVALLNRGVTRGQQGDLDLAHSDYTTVVELEGAPADWRALALVNRGNILSRQGDLERARSDYTAVVEMEGAPADQRAMARWNRGAALDRQGDVEQAVSDYTAVVEMEDAPADLRAMALVNRGNSLWRQGDVEQAVSDYEAVVEMDDAPVDQRASALINLGVTRERQGDVEQAVSDYTAVVEMEDAPTEQRTMALVNRGGTFGRQGELERALSDYAAVVEMNDAAADQRARALNGRGAVHWREGRDRASQRDFEAALSVPGVSPGIRTAALFNLPEPMVVTSSREAMLEALRAAFRQGEQGATEYGGSSHDLLTMVLRRGHGEWRGYIEELAPIYIEHGAAERLGEGVTRTIGALDAGGYSESQLDEWNAAWQEAGAGCDELELPLLSLNAATEAIKTKSDRPLFRLPSEVRELVRPLLTRSLGA